jgi:hypothetical protein
MRLKWLLLILIVGLATSAWAQTVFVPEGPRHFIVLVDTTASMSSRISGPNPWAKAQHLEQAEKLLGRALFHGSIHLRIPRYRAHQDLLTVIKYGIDKYRDSAHAYQRLKWADLTRDYIRRDVFARSGMTESQFRSALKVPQRDRTNLNVVAWAVPMALSAARVDPGRPVQDTYIVLLNDAQLNAGSVALEAFELGQWLGPVGTSELVKAQQLEEQNVRLTNARGAMTPLASNNVGGGKSLISIAAFEAAPLTTDAAASRLEQLTPLERLDIGRSGPLLSIAFNPPRALRGHQATIRLEGTVSVNAVSVDLEDRTTAQLGVPADADDKPATLVLTPLFQASNPILGQQEFTVSYRQQIVVPSSGAARRRFLANLATLLAVILFPSLVIWIYFQIFAAREVQLRLMGYAVPFKLPPLSQNQRVRYEVRVPSWPEDIAAEIVIPGKFVRRLFYRDFAIRWDQKLQLQTFPPETTESNGAGLPRVLRFVWKPGTDPSYEVSIRLARRLPFVKAQQIDLTIGFSNPRGTRD